jgi:murein DD-endopeptidase MepM/ murein hydrolase activator NlpD
MAMMLLMVILPVPAQPVGDIPMEETSSSYAEELQTRWPLSNSTTPDEMRSPFGPRIQSGVGYDFHRAIDIPAAEGTPIVAIMPGVIRIAGDHPSYSQPLVQVRHEYNGSTFYAQYQHLSAAHVVEDQVVEAGEVLGETGISSSGNPHLHFAIREEWVNKRNAANPMTYLPYADQGPPSLEANWQGDQLQVNVSVGNQELDFIELNIFGEGVDFHLNFDELNHATDEPDDLDNDTLVMGGATMTLLPGTYSSGQPRDYWFTFQFENETGDLEITAIDVLGQATTLTLNQEPLQNIQIQLDPMDVFSDVQLTWNASSDEGSVSEYVVYRSSNVLGPYQEIANITADGSLSYTYVDPSTGDDLSYFYEVHTKDFSDNQKQYGERVAKQVTNLNSGWNVFSVPLITASNSRTDILASIEGNYSSLQGYFPNEPKQWKHWHRGKSPELNDLETIDYGRGYYIYMDTEDYLVTAGEVNEISQIDLDKGWNLVGYPSLTSYNRLEGLNNLEFGTDVDAIQWFDAATKTWHFMDQDDTFVTGRGYWVYSRVEAGWEAPL